MARSEGSHHYILRWRRRREAKDHATISSAGEDGLKRRITPLYPPLAEVARSEGSHRCILRWRRWREATEVVRFYAILL
ncbi:MAG: hypothetical protein JW943_07395 [Deltaproteobacteria bacterium]|nr:hypothetical protein [Deltaproteobacteria bacterium]